MFTITFVLDRSVINKTHEKKNAYRIIHGWLYAISR